ncbi:MAG: hypothetical protein ACKVT0_23260 [Planctomycetaceae bacterium]
MSRGGNNKLRQGDAMFFRPRQLLLIGEAAAFFPALLRRTAATTVMLAGKGSRSVFCFPAGKVERKRHDTSQQRTEHAQANQPALPPMTRCIEPERHFLHLRSE